MPRSKRLIPSNADAKWHASSNNNFDLEKQDCIDIQEDITPEHLRCLQGTCPTVRKLSDGNLLIVGKRPSEQLYKQIQNNVSDDEFAIVISPEFFQNLLK